MATKKNNYIEVDIEFAENQLESWRQYVLNNPYEDVKDRIEWKPTKAGGTMPMVVASIEQQQKNLRDTMKDYLALLQEVKKLREAEDKKEELARGGMQIPKRMQKLQDTDGD